MVSALGAALPGPRPHLRGRREHDGLISHVANDDRSVVCGRSPLRGRRRCSATSRVDVGRCVRGDVGRCVGGDAGRCGVGYVERHQRSTDGTSER